VTKKRAALGDRGTRAPSIYGKAAGLQGPTTTLPGKAGQRKAYKPTTRPKCSLYLLPDVLERARNAADFLSGPPERLTLTALIERAVDAEVTRLAKKHHHGKPFPERSAPLRRGSRA